MSTPSAFDLIEHDDLVDLIKTSNHRIFWDKVHGIS